jgi:hypothetical protein
MTTLTTASLATEVLESTLLTLEQITTSLTVLALNASRNPGQSVRVSPLLSDLLADRQVCEEQLGTCGTAVSLKDRARSLFRMVLLIYSFASIQL